MQQQFKQKSTWQTNKKKLVIKNIFNNISFLAQFDYVKKLFLYQVKIGIITNNIQMKIFMSEQDNKLNAMFVFFLLVSNQSVIQY